MCDERQRLTEVYAEAEKMGTTALQGMTPAQHTNETLQLAECSSDAIKEAMANLTRHIAEHGC